MKNLAINTVLEEIKTSLQNNQTLILEAPPGAGKSTLVPLSLMQESYVQNKRILLLEPRRVAARTLAKQMSKMLNESIGQSVGYQIKNDSKYSKETKILIITEGVLIKKLQNDQSLEGIGLVIFDEFHERSIHSDLSLALCLEVQELLREDLKILLMSATLKEEDIRKVLPRSLIVRCKSSQYELQHIYLKQSIKINDEESFLRVLQNTCLEVIHKEKGDILVFLPGAREINTLKNFLEEEVIKDIDILPLYSALNQEEQDKAIYSTAKRKIVLATNIAQTSLTISGIRTVIDTGTQKVALFNHDTAMNQLKLSFISEQSAIQRAGRAARLGNGKCYRLWHKTKILEEVSKAEVLRADLSSFLLDLCLWGVKDLNEISLIDRPTQKSLNSTYELLQNLEMIDENLNISALGKEALALGLHPRLSYMILKASVLGYEEEACILAALLENKDIFNKEIRDCDLKSRFLAVINNERSFIIKAYALKEVKKEAKNLHVKIKKIKKITSSNKKLNASIIGVLLLFAYPDRLAKRREQQGNKYLLSNKKGATLSKNDHLYKTQYLVVSQIISKDKDSLIQMALKIEEKDIYKYFAHQIKKKESFLYNKNKENFECKEHLSFLNLELSVQAKEINTKEGFSKVLLSLIREEGLDLLSWSKKALQLRQRFTFLNIYKNAALFENEKYAKINDEYLLDNLEEWLESYLSNIKSIKALKNMDLFPILSSLLSYEEKKAFEVLLPTSIKVPSGTHISIDYSTDVAVLKVKIQEVFGLQHSPKILNNTLSLQIHLLSPSLQALQISNDLQSFWKNSYAEVRKELRGKYKRHYWPEDPYTAEATNKTKKNMHK